MRATKAGKGSVFHGRYSTYAHGCRCKECRDAWREYKKNLRSLPAR